MTQTISTDPSLRQQRRNFAAEQLIYPEMYGDVDGTADEVQINAALADQSIVHLRPATYTISSSIKMNDDNMLIGSGWDTIIQANLASDSLIESIDPSNRKYNFVIQDLKIDNTSSANGSSIAINLTKVTLAKLRNLYISNVETGVKISGTAYYNELISCSVVTAVNGIYIESGANENHIWGGKVDSTTTGIYIDNVSNIHLEAVSIENFTTGISVAPSNATTFTKIIGCRIEDDGDATGITIGSSAQSTFIMSPYFQNLGTNISDSTTEIGAASHVFSDYFWQCGSHLRLGNTDASLYCDDITVDMSAAATSFSIWTVPANSSFLPVMVQARIDDDSAATNGDYWAIGVNGANRRTDFGVCSTAAADNKHSKNAKLRWVQDVDYQMIDAGETMALISVDATTDAAGLANNIGGASGDQATVFFFGWLVENLPSL